MLSYSEQLLIIQYLLHSIQEYLMFYFLSEKPTNHLPYFLQLETLFQLNLHLFAELLLDAFLDVEAVYLLEKAQSNFIDTANNSDGHTLHSP